MVAVSYIVVRICSCPVSYRLEHLAVLLDAGLQLILLGEQLQQTIAFGCLRNDHFPGGNIRFWEVEM